jgi:UDP-GlcNAc3NAcA epimerase
VRIVSVIGTRPQLIKAAVLSPVLRARHDEVLVDTGQHYDDTLAGVFFRELSLPRPDHSLGVASASHAEQTAAMLTALEGVIREENPDAVLVYGDTNSTLAGALAAAKLGVRVAHVEAGLRSFDRRMPEEINRVIADHLSSWLFAPTPAAVTNLHAEGIHAGVTLTGDLMKDLAARVASGVRDPAVLAGFARSIPAGPSAGVGEPGLEPGEYVFATIHRAENREPVAIRRWVDLLSAVAKPGRPVVLPLHPGTRVALEREGVALSPKVRIVEPVGYSAALALQLHAAAVITDSGGVQREAGWLGTPCLILRETTEWVEQVAESSGTMLCVGLDRGRALEAVERLAPRARAASMARERVANLALRETGVADALSAVLADAPAAR